MSFSESPVLPREVESDILVVQLFSHSTACIGIHRPLFLIANAGTKQSLVANQTVFHYCTREDIPRRIMKEVQFLQAILHHAYEIEKSFS